MFEHTFERGDSGPESRLDLEPHLGRRARLDPGPGGRGHTLGEPMMSSRTVDDLLASARRSLTQATMASTPGERYADAHLAALRAAAAVLASSRSGSKRSRVQSVWVLLPLAAPEFAEWADFFAAGAGKRAAAAAGLACVSEPEADDLMRQADDFVACVCERLGRPHQRTLADALLHAG